MRRWQLGGTFRCRRRRHSRLEKLVGIRYPLLGSIVISVRGRAPSQRWAGCCRYWRCSTQHIALLCRRCCHHTRVKGCQIKSHGQKRRDGGGRCRGGDGGGARRRGCLIKHGCHSAVAQLTDSLAQHAYRSLTLLQQDRLGGLVWASHAHAHAHEPTQSITVQQQQQQQEERVCYKASKDQTRRYYGAMEQRLHMMLQSSSHCLHKKTGDGSMTTLCNTPM